MSYIGNSPGVASQRVETAFTATSSQTAFTPSSGYTLGYCDVYQNGVKLVNGDDYTASDGVTVTLATGAASGDSIVIVASFPRGLTDGYLKSEADAKYVALTGDQTVAGVKTLSSNPTLSGGTANGVAYLNGSKVVTSGSALVFDGSKLGIGTASPAYSLHVVDTIAAVGSTRGGLVARGNYAGQTDIGHLYFNNAANISVANIYALNVDGGASDSGTMVFRTASSGSLAERARLDSSGNFGIGATSPAAPLHIFSGTQEQIRLGRNATGSSGYITFFANNSSSSQVQYAGILGDVASSTAGSHSGNLLFYVTSSGTSAERMRIDSNGRLLVNNSSTPSAYPQKGVSVSGGVLYWHECFFGGASKVVTFSSDFNYFCELTVTVWGNASSGIYQGKFIAGRRDWTGANHMNNYADLIGTQLECSVSTSDSSNTRTYTVTFTQANDGANLHWSIEAKARNLYSFSVS
jgi:hypothetical protein